MTAATFLLLSPFAILGNAALWIVFWNRIQSTMMPMWILALLDILAKVGCLVLPLGIAALLVTGLYTPVGYVAQAYFLACIPIACGGIPLAVWQRRNLRIDVKQPLKQQVIYVHEARQESLRATPWPTRQVLSVPGNQSFEFEVNEKDLTVARLPRELDGLAIAHLSDLHFTGHVCKTFFDEVIDAVNAMRPEIIAVTGDLADRKECLAWIPTTLGRLRARHGVYVVLGNHDCKQNLPNLRLLLSEAGLTNLGGRLLPIEVRGTTIVLAGNELPWIAPAPNMELCPTRNESPHLRILLAHTPDEIDWAQHFDFDVMLAGHTHGGQFCLPWFGPFVCPSRLPMAYAAGTLYAEPTLLHVSRGLSGQVPLRLNCRPEITKLSLRCHPDREPRPALAKVDTFNNKELPRKQQLVLPHP